MKQCKVTRDIICDNSLRYKVGTDRLTLVGVFLG